METFKLSSDPFFIEKVRDIVGLYLNPPDRALVLCVDEKSQIQALDTAQLILQSARLGFIELSPASPELLEPLHSMQIPAEDWRRVLNDAYLRVTVARRHATEAHRAFSANGGSDGTHTYLRALREEARALAEYMKVVSLYTDFLHNGRGKRGR